MILAASVPTSTTAGAPVPSNAIGAIVVALVLILVSYPVIKRIAAAENEPWLAKVMSWALVLHILASPMQIWVVDHFYGGIADWNKYVHQGALLAPNFRGLHFTLAGSNLNGVVGDGAASIICGLVFAVIGTNVAGAFIVFSWFSWLGTIFFYRAFTVTFPSVSHKRYAYILFFFPSLIFWTSDVSKESVMVLSVGVGALGAARVLAYRRNGYPLLGIGTAIGAWIRPNELFLLYVGFVAGMLVRPKDPRRLLRGSRRLLGIAALAGLLVLSLTLTFKYLHGAGGSFSLQQIHTNNAAAGKSGIPYSQNIIYYPRDVYYVLFDPTPVTAHGNGERLESLETLIVIGLILNSLRRLRYAFRVGLNRPYVILCGVFCVAFCYTFAALGNLGLITRERTVMFPFFLVLLSIPLAPKNAGFRYPWEQRRFLRRRKRRGPQTPLPGAPPRPGAPVPAGAPAPGSAQPAWRGGAHFPGTARATRFPVHRPVQRGARPPGNGNQRARGSARAPRGPGSPGRPGTAPP